jgi:galacturan 1,4-alpha-galacturonidase
MKVIAHRQVIHKDGRCIITAHPTGGDDAPAILQAFELCGRDSYISFQDKYYNIYSVMNTTGLRNVKISLTGSLTVRLIAAPRVH